MNSAASCGVKGSRRVLCAAGEVPRADRRVQYAMWLVGSRKPGGNDSMARVAEARPHQITDDGNGVGTRGDASGARRRYGATGRGARLGARTFQRNNTRSSRGGD